MGVYNDEPKAKGNTDQMQIFYCACEMKQQQGSVSKVNEYQLALQETVSKVNTTD